MADFSVKFLRLSAGLAFATFCGSSSAAPPSPSILFTWPDRVMIRDAVGIVRVLDKPYGWGVKGITPGGHVVLEGGMKIGIGTKATAAFELYKMAKKSPVVKAIKPFIKLGGPVAAAGLVFDVIEWISDKWQVRENAPTIDQDVHWTGWGCHIGIGGSIFTKYDAGIVELTLVPFSSYASMVSSGWLFANNCSQWRDDEGQIPQLWYRVIDEFPDIEDVPYRDATDSEIENDISNAVGEDGSKLVPPLIHAIKEGLDVDSIPTMDAPNNDPIEGPTTVDGPTTTSTTTGPGGTTTTTTNTTYNISTTNNTINITSTTTTTTTKPDGTTETTETTETSGTEDGGGQDADPDKKPKPGESGGGESGNGGNNNQDIKMPDPVDVCVEHPDASGCAPLGTPEDANLDSTTRDVSLIPEMTDAGSCPPPDQLSIFGNTYELSWQPTCDFATGIRPMVLIVSLLGAGLFVFGVGAKGSS